MLLPGTSTSKSSYAATVRLLSDSQICKELEIAMYQVRILNLETAARLQQLEQPLFDEPSPPFFDSPHINLAFFGMIEVAVALSHGTSVDIIDWDLVADQSPIFAEFGLAAAQLQPLWDKFIAHQYHSFDEAVWLLFCEDIECGAYRELRKFYDRMGRDRNFLEGTTERRVPATELVRENGILVGRGDEGHGPDD